MARFHFKELQQVTGIGSLMHFLFRKERRQNLTTISAVSLSFKAALKAKTLNYSLRPKNNRKYQNTFRSPAVFLHREGEKWRGRQFWEIRF